MPVRYTNRDDVTHEAWKIVYFASLKVQKKYILCVSAQGITAAVKTAKDIVERQKTQQKGEKNTVELECYCAQLHVCVLHSACRSVCVQKLQHSSRWSCDRTSSCPWGLERGVIKKGWKMSGGAGVPLPCPAHDLMSAPGWLDH